MIVEVTQSHVLLGMGVWQVSEGRGNTILCVGCVNSVQALLKKEKSNPFHQQNKDGGKC